MTELSTLKITSIVASCVSYRKILKITIILTLYPLSRTGILSLSSCDDFWVVTHLLCHESALCFWYIWEGVITFGRFCLFHGKGMGDYYFHLSFSSLPKPTVGSHYFQNSTVYEYIVTLQRFRHQEFVLGFELHFSHMYVCVPNRPFVFIQISLARFVPQFMLP